ncbi:MAG: RNA polymerase sigma factor [Candidatus Thiodiazotropha sp. (ex Lucinoma annulata)]|nr:RNA polymerase sigma factor [Candidatus Thiodiazotropha sp. (ex Lucinoma borealis)]MCU7868094.1 RNA polymerase sigma factor [Candidatus Thiodiazotropha sp. (ex Lucinoma borealis)]MCU7885622.1 RNA polymerase sigma factor [Candidatus Thiodiazotropha sp. (ex Lucinoma annulata)]
MTTMILFGPAKAIRKRYNELNPRLYRLAWSWCHDVDKAQDLVQETWAKALEHSKQLRDAEKLLPWLSSIMVNLHRDSHRRKQDHLDIDNDELVGVDNTLDNINRGNDIQRVRDAVSHLPEDQRMVLTLVDLMELSYSQVADAMDIPIGTVMSRLSRSRRRLRELLETGDKTEVPTGIRRVK